MRRADRDHGDDFDAFDLRELVVEHRADIFRYARSFCRSDADAEDLAQNAVVRALASASLRQNDRAYRKMSARCSTTSSRRSNASFTASNASL